MEISRTLTRAASAVTEASGGVKQFVALAAMKSAVDQQASVLQLFDPAKAVPPPPPPSESGRGRVVDTEA